MLIGWYEVKLKKIAVSFISLIMIFSNIYINIFGEFYLDKSYYFNEVKNQIQAYISSQINNKSKKVVVLKAENIDLSDEEYQKMHDILQNIYAQKIIFDIYVKSNGQIIIPEGKFEVLSDSETQYNQEDLRLKNELSKMGIENISIINKKNNTKISSQYYNYIIYSIAKIYFKYFYLTDKYINYNNKLFSSFSIEEIKQENDGRMYDKEVVGQFLAEEGKLILSPRLFSGDYNKKTKETIEYTISHEMGHCIEFILCKKIFKDLNMSNISKRGLERLAELYFYSDSQIGEMIKNSVLNKMGCGRKSENEKRKFISENLSDYANTNQYEFFAEAVAYGSWKDETQNKYISSLVDGEIKDIINGQGETYNKIKETIFQFLKENGVL